MTDNLFAVVRGNKAFAIEKGVGVHEVNLSAADGYKLYDNNDGTYTVKVRINLLRPAATRLVMDIR